jgi:hypothetical protein
MSESAEAARFDTLAAEEWVPALVDPMTGDWREHWFLDGEKATLASGPGGLAFSAGPEAENAHHAVLWTKDAFEGDVRIEYDYTRLDEAVRYVNIIYIQATGSGKDPYGRDIAEWAHLRREPAMSHYFNHMHTLHVSYAAFGNEDDRDEDYVRARRYLWDPEKPGLDGTTLEEEYFLTGLFRPGVEHHFTFMKTGEDLFFEAKTAAEKRLFHWSLADVPSVTEGRIGLRHMHTRAARYKDFRIWTRG